MSTVRTIARDDIGQRLRSRTAVTAILLFTCLVIVSWIPWMGSQLTQADDRPLLLAIRQAILWTPLFALALGAVSVASTAESSQSQPHADSSRAPVDRPTAHRDTLVGTLIGRLTILVGVCSILVACLAGLVVLESGTVSPASVAGGLLALILFGAAWLGLTVGVAVLLETVPRTVGLVLGFYALFGFLWRDTVVALVSLLVSGGTDPNLEEPVFLVSLEEPTWYLYVTRVNPFDAVEAAIYYLPRALESVLGGSTTVPHLPNLFGLGVLVLWAIGPVVVGYWWSARRTPT